MIVGGELVKAKPNFHIEHTFQGQKGKDPQTENPGRDPERDGAKTMSFDDVTDHLKNVRDTADADVANAKHARRPVRSFADVTNGVPLPERPSATPDDSEIDEVKKTQKIADGKEQPSELGESADDDEDDNVKQLADEEDDDEMTDENDVAEALDSDEMDAGIDSE